VAGYEAPPGERGPPAGGPLQAQAVAMPAARSAVVVAAGGAGHRGH
jgi:hypothetical protein